MNPNNPNNLTPEQLKQGYSTIPGAYDPVTGQLKSNTITPSSLTPVTPIDLSKSFSTPTDTGNSLAEGAKTSANTFQTNYQNYLNMAEVPKSDTANRIDTLMSSLTGDIQGLNGRGSAQSNAESQYGVNQYSKDLADTNAQILEKTASRDKMISDAELNASKSGQTYNMFLGSQGAIQRGSAAEIGLLQAKALGLQGQLQAAQNAANRAVDLMYADRESTVNTKLKQLELLQGTLTKEEEKKASALSYALDKEKVDIADRKSLTTSLAENGVTDMKVYDSIKNAKSFNDAIALAAPYIKKNNNEIVKLGDNAVLIDKTTGKIIKTLKASTDSGVSTTTGNLKVFDSLISTASNLETSVAGKKAVKNQLIGMIKNQDYQGAYNQVANTVSTGLSGETRTRFDNARIDKEVLGGFKNALQDYIDAGGSTGLLKGTAESIYRNLGQVKDPKLTSLAVQLQREFQTYRNTMTGAAFTPQESKEYASVNPTSNKSLDLNLAVIDGAINQLDNRITGTIRAKVPQATSLIDLVKSQNPVSPFSQALQATTPTSIFNSSQGWIIPTK